MAELYKELAEGAKKCEEVLYQNMENDPIIRHRFGAFPQSSEKKAYFRYTSNILICIFYLLSFPYVGAAPNANELINGI